MYIGISVGVFARLPLALLSALNDAGAVAIGWFSFPPRPGIKVLWMRENQREELCRRSIMVVVGSNPAVDADCLEVA